MLPLKSYSTIITTTRLPQKLLLSEYCYSNLKCVSDFIGTVHIQRKLLHVGSRDRSEVNGKIL